MAPARLGISLGLGCSDACNEFAAPLFLQMSSGKYDECATMPLPASVGEWEAEHRTARKRAWRAERLGYGFSPIVRHLYEREVYDINVSSDARQGRPMSDGYRRQPSFGVDSSSCSLHGVHPYGVFDREAVLVAYLWMYRAGDLALVSQVLGHADHEEHGIMQLLFREALMEESLVAPGVCVYNRWDSGKDGLRQAKGWVGFEPTPVEWLP